MHAGDLSNSEAGADRRVKIDLTGKEASLEKGKPNSLIKEGGTSTIIHEKEDDYATDPAGNAGARIAGGIIVEVKQRHSPAIVRLRAGAGKLTPGSSPGIAGADTAGPISLRIGLE
jgi:hypothetical protein